MMAQQQIRRFGIGQAVKVSAVLYTLMGVLLVPFFVLATSMAPGTEGAMPWWFIAAMPVVYGVIGVVSAVVGCLFYNLVAGWVGGIEIEVIETA
jgi:hypothetical protein